MLQLASMVPVPQREQRYEPQMQHPHHHHLSSHHMPPQDSRQYQTSSAVPNTYNSPERRYDYNYQTQMATQTPSAPPSPPGDDGNKPSLPSISSLLGISEAKQGDQGQQPQQEQQQPQQIVTNQSPEYSSDALAQGYGGVVVNSRISLPPTPPLVSDTSLEGNQSPSTISTQSTVSQTYYMGPTVATVDAHHRGSFSETHIPKRLSIASQPGISAYPTPHYTPSNYVATPTTIHTASYYPDNPILPSSGGLYSQRPLPSNFPPPVSIPIATPGASAQNPWQHHHYISPSSQASYPQSQDRYVCPTCNKAFSRPSSLRIHSHSHTGEKPFRCSHVGCGKAFSVRSNMKRHERGCHAANNPVVANTS